MPQTPLAEPPPPPVLLSPPPHAVAAATSTSPIPTSHFIIANPFDSRLGCYDEHLFRHSVNTFAPSGSLPRSVGQSAARTQVAAQTTWPVHSTWFPLPVVPVWSGMHCWTCAAARMQTLDGPPLPLLPL